MAITGGPNPLNKPVGKIMGGIAPKPKPTNNNSFIRNAISTLTTATRVPVRTPAPKPNFIQKGINALTTATKVPTRTTTTTTQNKSVPAPAPSSYPPGGGGGGGGTTSSSDGGVAGGDGGVLGADAAAIPAPEVVVPDINADSWLIEQMAKYDRDKGYQDTKNKSDREKYATGYNDTMRSLGWDASALGGQGDWNNDPQSGMYGTALRNNVNDFASRGALDSGFFFQSDADIKKDFADRRTGLIGAKTQYDADIDAAWNAYLANDVADRQSDTRSTIERLAAQYNVDKSKIPNASGWGL